MEKEIKALFDKNIELHRASKEELVVNIVKAADLIINSYKQGKKVLFCGNGGSAADAQHLAAELVGRFKKERRGLPAIALTTDASIMTAISNDYWYDLLFARQIEALGDKDDILVAISTSGNSSNIIRALEAARFKGLKTVAFLGADGGKLKNLVDIPLVVPSWEADRTQEVHIFLGHIICHFIDEKIF